MAQESEQEKTKRDLENLEEILRAADENGLFLEKWEPKHPHSEILDEIYKGKNYIKDPAKTTEARKQYNLAFNKLYSTKNNTRWTWRATYQYGVPMFIYFFVNAIIMFASWIFYSSAISASTILWIPSWAFLWGAIGAILQGVWRLWHDIEDQLLRKHLIAWYFILPFMGSILGALVYLVFYAGFIVATGSGQITSESFVMLLSGLAGFSSKWTVMMFERVTDLIQPQRQ